MGVTGERSTIDASPKELVAPYPQGRCEKRVRRHRRVHRGTGGSCRIVCGRVIVGSALVHTMLDESGKHAVDEATGLKALAAKTEELAEGIHNARN